MSRVVVGALEAQRTSSIRRGNERGQAPPQRSHAVVLIKPEALSPLTLAPVLETVLGGLAEHGVSVGRWLAEPAPHFLRRGCLIRHYPRLHRIAADGRSALSPDAFVALSDLAAELGLDASDAVTPLDVFAMEPGLGASELDRRLRGCGIRKLGAGSYASPVPLGGRVRLLLNGFVPGMSAGYAGQDRLVVALEIMSTREIADLRSSVLGALDPAEAASGTLRKRVAQTVRELGACELSEGRNGVHLSAGHLEGMYQAWNYLGAAAGEEYSHTALGRDLVGRGITLGLLRWLAADPSIQLPGLQGSAFGITEGLSREEVLDFVTKIGESAPCPLL